MRKDVACLYTKESTRHYNKTIILMKRQKEMRGETRTQQNQINGIEFVWNLFPGEGCNQWITLSRLFVTKQKTGKENRRQDKKDCTSNENTNCNLQSSVP